MLSRTRHCLCILAARKDDATKALRKERRKEWEKGQKESALKRKQLHPNSKVSYVEREDGIWEERRSETGRASRKPAVAPCKAEPAKDRTPDTSHDARKLGRRDELKRAGYRQGIFPLSELLSAKMVFPPPPPTEWVEAEIRRGMSPLGEEPWVWIKEGFEEDSVTPKNKSSLVEKPRKRVVLPSQPWKDLRGLREYRSQQTEAESDHEWLYDSDADKPWPRSPSLD